MGKITFNDKVKINELTDVPAINKVQDVDMNEIKTSVNTIYDGLGLGTDTYSTSTSYVEGNRVVYNGLIYECINATSGVWDIANWSLVPIIEYEGLNPVLLDNIDTGWLALPLASGITAQSASDAYTPQYRKIGNVVYIEGCVKGATANNTVLATLPEGFRPVHIMRYMTGRSGGANAVLGLSTNGELVVVNFADGSAISASSYIYIQTSFLAN